MFFTFEGIEGSGKTTVSNLVYEKLKKNLPNEKFLMTWEPGGKNDECAEAIRRLILKHSCFTAKTEAYLYAASRAQHVENVILPHMKRGYHVLCDRYLDSALAYQGGAMGLGYESVYKINMEIWKDTLKPDVVFFFDLEPSVALKRIKSNRSATELTHYDLKKIEFHEKVRESYLGIPEKFISVPYKIIDATKNIDEITNEVYEKMVEIIKNDSK